MESKPLEGVNVFAWFTQPLIFSFSLSLLEEGQKGRKTHGEIAEDIDKLPPLNTAVAPLTWAFPVSGIALGFQQRYSAENSLLESAGTFIYVSRPSGEARETRESKKSWMVEVMDRICITYKEGLEELCWFGS